MSGGTRNDDPGQMVGAAPPASSDRSPSGPAGDRIRSFVRREGRITRAQRRALDELWPAFGLDSHGPLLDFSEVFDREAPCCLEIGFGNGDALVSLAEQHPECDFLGVDVHRPGIGSLLLKLEKNGLDNVRVFGDDAVEVLETRIPDDALARVMLFFPDPWPKKRHHKRRILQPAFVELVRRKLSPGGIFHMATDWRNYAEQMLDVMERQPRFGNVAGPGVFSSDRGWRPSTRFEGRGIRLGHDVWDLIYQRES